MKSARSKKTKLYKIFLQIYFLAKILPKKSKSNIHCQLKRILSNKVFLYIKIKKLYIQMFNNKIIFCYIPFDGLMLYIVII